MRTVVEYARSLHNILIRFSLSDAFVVDFR